MIVYGKASVTEKVEAFAATALGTPQDEIGSFKTDLARPFQHYQPVLFQHIAFKNYLQGIGIFEHGVGWVKVNQIKLKSILAQGDDRAVEIAADHPEKIAGNTDFFSVVPDGARRLRQIVDEYHVFGAAGKGFNADIAGAGEAVEKNFFLDAILQDIKKSELQLGHGWADDGIFSAAQHPPLVKAAGNSDH